MGNAYEINVLQNMFAMSFCPFQVRGRVLWRLQNGKQSLALGAQGGLTHAYLKKPHHYHECQGLGHGSWGRVQDIGLLRTGLNGSLWLHGKVAQEPGFEG